MLQPHEQALVCHQPTVTSVHAGSIPVHVPHLWFTPQDIKCNGSILEKIPALLGVAFLEAAA